MLHYGTGTIGALMGTFLYFYGARALCKVTVTYSYLFCSVYVSIYSFYDDDFMREEI